MPSRRLFMFVYSEYRALLRILPVLALALLLGTVLAPTLTSLASVHLASPLSPISPVRRLRLPPTFLPPAAGAAQTSPLAITQTPERVRPTTPAVETPVQVLPPPPPPSPAVAQPVASPPPTLWIVVGLLVIGAIVAALIFFRKP
jgi:hypothetical protein